MGERISEFDPRRRPDGSLIDETVVNVDALTTKTTKQPTTKQPTTKQPTTPQNIDIPTVFRNNKTGAVSGASLPDGRTFLGLSPSEVRTLLEGEQQKRNTPTGAVEQRDVGQIRKDLAAAQGKKIIQQQAAQSAEGLGLTPEQIAQAEAQATNTPVDIGQALTAGTVKNAPSLLGNIAGGAITGAAVAAPVSAALASTGVGAIPAGVIIGGAALAGAVKSIWGGVQQNIANQQKGEIGAAQDVLVSAKTDMRLLATLAAKDPANAERYVEAYNARLAAVYQARAKIKLETQGNLNKFTEDGTDILSNFDLFLQPNGAADLYKNRLYLALNTGVAPEFTEEDILSIQ